MLICIPQVLSRDQAARILDVLAGGDFVDGRLSAGEMARDVKHNLEYQRPENKPTEIDQMVGTGLMGSRTFHDFALPKQIAPPIFSRYEPGMEYGTHVDTALMGRTSVIRSDLSLTLFLSDPASYDGGELTVETTFGEQQVKLPPGPAVVYASTTLHRVAPVTRGARIVALSWVQSYVRDEGMREILFDLAIATQALDTGGSPGDIKNRLYKTYANLMRREAEV
jgi:PKHD-type hydroxylase